MSEAIRELPETAVPHGEAVTRTRDAEPAEQVEVSGYLKPRATMAAHDETNQPSVISVSWGERESLWGLAEMASVTSALGGDVHLVSIAAAP